MKMIDMSDLRPDLTKDDFRRIFLEDIPLMDVRAPIEFGAGSFPVATNRPILDDPQRHEIGCVYADKGQDAAIERGLQMATADIRQQRMETWSAFVRQNPEGYLYCFRGGLRSKTTQAWLAEAGYPYPLVQGGYKALRRFLLDEFARLLTKGNILLLSGETGTGKTELIEAWHSSIDLEGRAKHRGSAFGRTFVEQPSQIDWENQIIIDWLKVAANSAEPVLVEAESHLIGRIHLPQNLQDAMAEAPVLMLEAPIQERVQRLRDDYVQQALDHFRLQGPQQAGLSSQAGSADEWGQLKEHIASSLSRIKKRLGGVRYQALDEQLSVAVRLLRDHNDNSGIDAIIETLLLDYYDRLYAHQQQKQSHSIVCQGDMQTITHWLEQQKV